VIPEIYIWRAANLMLKRYGEKAFEESSTRADELAADGDHDGASTWRRITDAVVQLANNASSIPLGKMDRFCPEADLHGHAGGFSGRQRSGHSHPNSAPCGAEQSD
jgi:hypothetical protein